MVYSNNWSDLDVILLIFVLSTLLPSSHVLLSRLLAAVVACASFALSVSAECAQSSTREIEEFLAKRRASKTLNCSGKNIFKHFDGTPVLILCMII